MSTCWKCGIEVPDGKITCGCDDPNKLQLGGIIQPSDLAPAKSLLMETGAYEPGADYSVDGDGAKALDLLVKYFGEMDRLIKDIEEVARRAKLPPPDYEI